MLNLGLLYEMGDGCEKNEKKAFELYEKSSNLGFLPGIRIF